MNYTTSGLDTAQTQIKKRYSPTLNFVESNRKLVFQTESRPYQRNLRAKTYHKSASITYT